MLRIVCRLVPLVFLSLFAFSCADAAKHLRAQPAWFLEPKSALKIPLPALDEKSGVPTEAPAAEIEIKCVRTPRSESVTPTENAAVPQCLYMSMDMNRVLNVPTRNRFERNRLVHLLVNVSDNNCSTFLMRAFAHKAGAEAARNTGKDIATAIAAGTARVAGGFASGLGLVNLAGGTAIDSFNTTYYADKTFQMMAAAIGAERSKARKVIVENSIAEIGDYSFFEALEDMHDYDDSCSIRRGLESLASAANSEKKDKDQKLNDKREELRASSTKAGPATAVASNQQ
ncbi:MAG: hypothetical protein AABO58_11880 [Acidobacteriota bacterium]